MKDNESTQDFSIFLPIEKSLKSDEEHGRFVRGYASTPEEDVVGDVVLPSEINITSFMSRGYINYEHEQGDMFKIGMPTDKSYIDPNRGLFVEAKLFSDNPYADKMWELAKRIDNGDEDSTPENMLGFSIEGSFSHRDPQNPRIMKNVFIKNVALTVNPKNKHASWQAFTKSLTTGNDVVLPGDTGGKALRRQVIARNIRNISYASQDFSEDDWTRVAKALDEEHRFDKPTAALFLQIHKGYSKRKAQSILGKD